MICAAIAGAQISIRGAHGGWGWGGTKIFWRYPPTPCSNTTGIINLDKNHESQRTLICDMFPPVLLRYDLLPVPPSAMPVINTWPGVAPGGGSGKKCKKSSGRTQILMWFNSWHCFLFSPPPCRGDPGATPAHGILKLTLP